MYHVYSSSIIRSGIILKIAYFAIRSIDYFRSNFVKDLYSFFIAIIISLHRCFNVVNFMRLPILRRISISSVSYPIIRTYRRRIQSVYLVQRSVKQFKFRNFSNLSPPVQFEIYDMTKVNSRSSPQLCGKRAKSEKLKIINLQQKGIYLG